MKKKLILLHGAIGASDQLEKLKVILSDNFDVCTIDFPGHGKKSADEFKFSIEYFAKSLEDFIQENKLENIYIFGYSMGGYVALYHQLNYKNSIQAICTLGTKFSWTEEIAAKEVKMLNPTVIEEKVPAFAKSLGERHGDHWQMVLNKTSEMMLQMGKANPLTPEKLKSISIPVQFLLGENDKMVSIEETELFAGAVKNSKLKIIHNTEHPIEKVNIETLKEILLNFF